VPVNKLAELPAIRYALSTHGTFAKSACGLLKNDSSPRKENPRLRMTRLILAEIFCRCLCLFIRALFEGYGLPAVIFQSRDLGVTATVRWIGVLDAWTGAGGSVVLIIKLNDLVQC
jgi:hypothetical protein